MNEPIWNKFLTARDKQVFASAAYRMRQGALASAALLIVDVNYDFREDNPSRSPSRSSAGATR